MIRRRLLHKKDSELVPESRGYIDGFEYVDLGLPSGTLWATCNVGASDETETGDYYQYGAGDKVWVDINTNNSYQGSDDIYKTEHDTAYVMMGENWATPSFDQIDELRNSNYTTLEWAENFKGSGVNGLKVSKKDNPNVYCFFPACGYHYMMTDELRGAEAPFYQTRTVSQFYGTYAVKWMYAYSENLNASTTNIKTYATPIRGVVDNN